MKNGNQYLIREATKEDAASLLRFLEVVGGETEYLTFGPGEMQPTLEEETSFIESFRQNPQGFFLVAVVSEGQVAGTAHFSGGSLPRIRHAGEIGISVQKAYWGQGIGEALTDELLAWIRERKHIRKINLKVRVDNQRAIALYRKKGFVTEGTLSREFRVGDVFHSVFCMGLQLDP